MASVHKETAESTATAGNNDRSEHHDENHHSKQKASAGQSESTEPTYRSESFEGDIQSNLNNLVTGQLSEPASSDIRIDSSQPQEYNPLTAAK